MELSKSAWSREYGVSRAAVTKAVQAGNLVETQTGGLDQDHPVNAAWIKKKKRGGGASEKKKTALPPAERKKPVTRAKSRRADPPEEPIPPGPEEEPGESFGILTIQKLQAEIKVKREQAQAYRIKRLNQMKTLVELEEVRRGLAQYNAEQKIRLLEMPGTIAPRLIALARAGAAEYEIAELLAGEIEKAISSSKLILTRAELLEKE